MSKYQVPIFKSSNALYEAIDSNHRSHIPNFDILQIDKLDGSYSICMPPYRQEFYQISILTYVGKSKLNINTDWLELGEHPLWFSVPGQIVSWMRDENIAGFNIMFKKEFLSHSFQNLNEDFPFLKMSENRALMMTKEEMDSLIFDAKRMLSVFENPHPYQEKMLEGMLISFLYYCKAIFDKQKSTENNLSRRQILTQKFENLVDKMYIDTKNVRDYANILNVTPSYLTTIIKQQTGKSAKDIIQERLLIESKSLLKFTDLDIAEIGYRLNFQEPTHFTRFFKNLSGTTPNRFRQQ